MINDCIGKSGVLIFYTFKNVKFIAVMINMLCVNIWNIYIIYFTRIMFSYISFKLCDFIDIYNSSKNIAKTATFQKKNIAKFTIINYFCITYISNKDD